MGFASRLNNILALYGVDVTKFFVAARNTPRFVRDARRFARLSSGTPFSLSRSRLFPILDEFDASAGVATGHYFWQDLWAARKIFAAKPARHLDVGSRIDGFVAHLLVFMPVAVADIRPLQSDVDGLTFMRADATNLAAIEAGSVESLSCLHAAEHIGLGRYGDPISADGPFAAMREFARILAQSGRLYFSVPIGRERTYFNAHRIFDPATIVNSFAPSLELQSFSAVGDDGRFHENADMRSFASANFACGLFEFVRRA